MPSTNVVMKPPRALPHCLFACALLAGAAPLAAAAASGIDSARLTESQVTMVDVSRPGAPGKAFAAGTIIAAPLARICATLQDYASYPGFMPNTESAKVTATAADHKLVDMTLKLPMGKVKKYRLKMEGQSGAQRCQLSWKLVPWEGLKPEETIADTTGAWILTPAADPTKTVVNYTVYTDPGPVPLGLGWIVDSLSKDSIPKMLDALRAKVK